MAPPANPSSPLNNKVSSGHSPSVLVPVYPVHHSSPLFGLYTQETEYNAIRCISPKGGIEIGGDGRGDISSRPSAYIDQHSLLRKVEDEEEDGADNEEEGENDIGGIEVRSLVRGTGNQVYCELSLLHFYLPTICLPSLVDRFVNQQIYNP